ncbi:Crp/Fnr family transcriptional regulator [uncultured Vagococcus sp.]|uniref:Crp/Fnr family transcriptional regulator n=1 Tax=uncultured Vagococcus sp. TaxID=189676 RepID=UPI0028D845A6|nr:Crp/Fnr family transcriptional regulator [uncultured Vagococcus sp.]
MKNLSEISLFHHLEASDLEEIDKHLILKEFKKNEVLIRMGDKVQELSIIIEGSIEICSYDMNGNKKLITVLEEGDLFAESVAFDQEAISPFDIMAIQRLKVIQLSRTTILNFPRQVLANLIGILATKNTFLTHKLECINKNTVKDRLYEVLNFYRFKQQSDCFTLPFNKTQLADYLCVNRSSLSREIHLMEKAGIIAINKQDYRLNPDYF